jgi:hypothetical protein
MDPDLRARWEAWCEQTCPAPQSGRLLGCSWQAATVGASNAYSPERFHCEREIAGTSLVRGFTASGIADTIGADETCNASCPSLDPTTVGWAVGRCTIESRGGTPEITCSNPRCKR